MAVGLMKLHGHYCNEMDYCYAAVVDGWRSKNITGADMDMVMYDEDLYIEDVVVALYVVVGVVAHL